MPQTEGCSQGDVSIDYEALAINAISNENVHNPPRR